MEKHDVRKRNREEWGAEVSLAESGDGEKACGSRSYDKPTEDSDPPKTGYRSAA